jgi:hypothetical protein
MDLAKWCPDRFAISGHYCRPRRSVGPSMIANRAHTRGIRAILPKVQKTMDWMVDDAVCSEPVSVNCQPVDTLTAVDKAVVDSRF